jgi:hypothetical protein
MRALNVGMTMGDVYNRWGLVILQKNALLQAQCFKTITHGQRSIGRLSFSD